MTKAIIMTIRPKHLVKILNGIKTIEIRKTIPKNIELPCDVYLVCSKAKPYLYTYSRIKENSDWEWEQVFFVSKEKNVVAEKLNGKVVCKFTLNSWNEMPFWEGYYDEKPHYEINPHDIPLKACLSIKELNEYGKGKDLYAYHIDNLVIFDEPKALNEFYKQLNYGKEIITPNIATNQETTDTFRITKAPQFWQYCYVKGE